ncbi:MAG: hypothetical protein IPP14_04815 [Planctomycetes bacterium]|nr:hypothetical protein [Planctomycetota bacterium]
MRNWMLALVLALGATGLAAQDAPKAEPKAEPKKAEAKPEKKEALTLDKLPEAAKTAITKLAGDNKLTKLVEKGKKDAKTYKAEWTADSKDHEVVVSAEGKVLKSEDDVDAKDVPQTVQDAAKKAAPEGAKLEWVKITEGTKTLFEATASKDGKELKTLLLDGEGKVQADDDDDDAEEGKGHDADDDDGEEDDDDHEDGEEDDDD